MCPPVPLGGGKATSVHITPGDQHIILGALWVGEVYLIQNDHIIPDMQMQKMYQYFRSCHRSFRTALNRASFSWGGHPVLPRFLTRGRGCPTMSRVCRLPMYCPHVPCHQTKSHILPTLVTLNLSLLPISLGRDLSCHPLPIRQLRLFPCHLEWAENHAGCTPDIGTQSHPIKQTGQGASN